MFGQNMTCQVPMNDITSSASAYSSSLATQDALNVISLMNILAYVNPYSGCVSNNSVFDFIIVGGGTAGSVLGNRLSEDGTMNVLLIEAGGNFPIESGLPFMTLYTKRSRFDWNYTAVPDEFLKQCHQSSSFMPTIAKVLGGDSAVDYMIYSQGEDRDYDEWAKLTKEQSWCFNNVIRLFKKVERFNDDILKKSPDSAYHGFSGNIGLTKERSAGKNKYIEAFEQVGYPIVSDINNQTKLGYTNAVFYIDGNIRQNAAYAYLYPKRNLSNLVVLKNTQVTKILLDKDNKVTGVEAISLIHNIKFVYHVRKEVIVTAGVFNTVKLLQLSGIGPKKILDKFKIPVISDLPVGANYQNHMSTIVAFAGAKTNETFIPENFNPFSFPGPAFVGYVALDKHNPYADYRTLSFVVTYTPDPVLLQYTTIIYRFQYDINDYWYNETKGRELVFTLLENTKPISRGRVQIRSRNPFDTPIIETGFFSNDNDVKDLIKYLKDYLRVLKSQNFKKFGAFLVDPTQGRCGKYEADSNDYWRCYVLCLSVPVSHHAGTAALGSVVDGRLRVYGVKGLRVADASIMPRLIPGSITIPTMMIAENGAEMIKEDWKY